MKKIIAALTLVALGSVSWAATSLNSSGMQKGTPPPETDSISLNSSRSNVYKRGNVTDVDPKAKTFTVELNFSAQNLKDPFPEVGKIYDIIYTETASGGPLEATTVNSSKSNSFRLTAGQKVVTGKVTKVDARNKTFIAEVTFSAKNLTSPLPEVGKSYDVTVQTTPGGPQPATITVLRPTPVVPVPVKGVTAGPGPTTGNLSLPGDWTVSATPGGPISVKVMTGALTSKVLAVNPRNNTFTVEANFSGANLEALPTLRDVIDINYNPPPTPGGPQAATTVKGSKSNVSFRVAPGQESSLLTGTVMQVNARNKTFTVEVTFSSQNLKLVPAVGTIYDITFQRTPGGPLVAVKLNSSKSNIY